MKRSFYIALFLVGLWGSTAKAISLGSDLLGNQEACAKYLIALKQRVPKLNVLTADHEALANQMLQIFGRRLFQAGPESFRDCLDGQCLVFKNFATDPSGPKPKELRVEFVDPSESPSLWIYRERGMKVLKIPHGFDYNSLPDKGRETFMQWALGHPLHPYLASKETQKERIAVGEDPFFLKEVQLEAQKAVLGSTKDADLHPDDSSKRRLLVVAPTGTGKTKILEAFLSDRLKHSDASGRKLHILMAHTDELVDQLASDVKHIRKPHEVEVLRWPNAVGPQSISDLADYVKASSKPVVIVSTVQTMVARMAESRLGPNPTEEALAQRTTTIEKNASFLHPHLESITQDEAHHSNALQTRHILESLVDRPKSKGFLYGTTATPFHQDAGLIDRLYGERAFWTYLDSAERFLEKGGRVERDIDEVVDQLSQAVRRGELTPFNKTFFLLPEDISPEGDLFIKKGEGQGTKYYLNPQHLPALLSRLAPRFKQHKHGFVSVGSVTEANDLVDSLNRLPWPTPRKFAALHSRMTKQEQKQVLDGLRKGEVNFVVTPRMLDEGINVPDLSLYVDLNHSVGPRQFLQRVGRVLRLAPGKESIDVVTLMSVDETNIRDNIHLLTKIREGGLKPGIKIVDADEVEQLKDRDQEEEGIERMGEQLEKVEEQLRQKEFWKANAPALTLADDLIVWHKSQGEPDRLPGRLDAGYMEKLGSTGARQLANMLRARLSPHLRTYDPKVENEVKFQLNWEKELLARINKLLVNPTSSQDQKAQRVFLDALKEHPQLLAMLRSHVDERRSKQDVQPKLSYGSQAIEPWMEWTKTHGERIPFDGEAPHLLPKMREALSNARRVGSFSAFIDHKGGSEAMRIQMRAYGAFVRGDGPDLRQKGYSAWKINQHFSGGEGVMDAELKKMVQEATEDYDVISLLSPKALKELGIEDLWNSNREAFIAAIPHRTKLVGDSARAFDEAKRKWDEIIREEEEKARQKEVEEHLEALKKVAEDRRHSYPSRFEEQIEAQRRMGRVTSFLEKKLGSFIQREYRFPSVKATDLDERILAQYLVRELKMTDIDALEPSGAKSNLLNLLKGAVLKAFEQYAETEANGEATVMNPKLKRGVEQLIANKDTRAFLRNKLSRAEREVFDRSFPVREVQPAPKIEALRIGELENLSVQDLLKAGVVDKVKSDSAFAAQIINHYFGSASSVPETTTKVPFQRLVLIILQTHGNNLTGLSPEARSALK